jgi:histidinol phosphatase-like enzyme (inositol monophosphatase family)
MTTDIVKDCTEISALASKAALGFFRKQIGVEFKSDDSPVTHADKSVEALVRAEIARRHPDHGILGEEHGQERTDHPDLWVVDPIDGTRSFISGHPLFGFLLAYLHEGAPQVGVIAMPALDETYVGASGQGATLNGAPIRVSSQAMLDHAIIYINEGDKIFADNPDLFAVLMRTGKTRRLSYDCYPHALLASGHVDVVVDYDLKPYDFLALRPVIEAAGGCLTDWQGNIPRADYEGAIVASATSELHDQMLTILRGARP